MLTHITGVFPSLSVAGTDPDVVTDVLVQTRLLEQVVTLRVGDDGDVDLN